MNNKHWYLFAAFFIIAAHVQVLAQKSYIESIKQPNAWVDKKLKKMSKKERVAQLFFVRGLSNQNKTYNDSLVRLIKHEHIGGVIFFQGGPIRQALLSNRLQANSRVPLLIAMDAEWGLGMRLDSTISYPYQMALGAIQNPKLIEEMGKYIAQDFKLMGMHLNFAPDVDINNNPKNPVINYRSFGENKENVLLKAGAYMRGMQSEGILTSLKHFPGHGDTEVDSHLGLPVINHPTERLMQTEIYPFYQLIQQAASGVMVAHLSIPSLDATPNIPSTLSRPIITELLKKKLDFKGLVITDAMEMKAVAKSFAPGIADLKAVEAGNDIIELSENVHLGIKTVLKKARSNPQLMAQIDESVRKILWAKYWASDSIATTIQTAQLIDQLNNRQRKNLQTQLAEAAITVIKGKKEIQDLRFENSTAIINISNSTEKNDFERNLSINYNAGIYHLKNTESSPITLNTLLSSLKNYQQIILSITDERTRPAIKLPISEGVRQLIAQVCAMPNSHLALFANPYCLAEIRGSEKTTSICIAYQKESFMQKAAAKLFCKQLQATGTLPVSINSTFRYGAGN